MNVGTFIKDREKRWDFILTVSSLLPLYESEIDHMIIMSEMPKLSKEQIGSANDALFGKYTEFPLYADRMVAALEIVIEKCNKEMISENITRINFRVCKYNALDSSINLDVKIEMIVGKSNNAKLIILCHSAHFSFVPNTWNIYSCDRFNDKIFYNGNFNNVIYNGNLVFTQYSSNEIDEMINENRKMKNELVCLVMTKFLPRDLISIVMSFKPFDCQVKFKAVECWFGD